MRIRYLALAIRDLDGVFSCISRENPKAASAVVDEIRSFVSLLRDVPEAGRRVGRGGLRVFGVPRRPYLIYYRRLSAEIRILRVRHGRRRSLKL